LRNSMFDPPVSAPRASASLIPDEHENMTA
jgi:hypothetical protein